MPPFVTRMVLGAVLITAALMLPSMGRQDTEKTEPLRWIVDTTANYKGHASQLPDSVECVTADTDLSHSKIIIYSRWRELNKGDTCPEGDR